MVKRGFAFFGMMTLQVKAVLVQSDMLCSHANMCFRLDCTGCSWFWLGMTCPVQLLQQDDV